VTRRTRRNQVENLIDCFGLASFKSIKREKERPRICRLETRLVKTKQEKADRIH
jgi:hypothetical protein